MKFELFQALVIFDRTPGTIKANRALEGIQRIP